jgi:ATP-dependent DNA ligase
MICEPQKVLHLSAELKKKKPKIADNFIVSEKLDGWFGFMDYIPRIGVEGIFSSSCREIPSLQYITNNLLLSDIDNYFRDNRLRFIGEIIIPDVNFHTLNGILNRKYEPAENAQFYIHDVLNLKNFWTDKEENTAIGRYKRLCELFISIPSTHIFHKYFKILRPIELNCSLDTAINISQQIIADDAEGVILKAINGVYSPGNRNSSLMKIKRQFDIDLVCIGWERTIGEKGNLNYNLIFMNKGTSITVRLGKHEDIALLIENENNFVGKICELQAMEELENGALREPRFYRRK